MSETATLTRLPGVLRTAAMILAADDGFGMRSSGMEAAIRARVLLKARPDGCRPTVAAWHSSAADGLLACAAMGPPWPGPEHASHERCLGAARMTHAGALVALHAAVALFGFAGLFGKWLALSPVAIVLGGRRSRRWRLGSCACALATVAPFDVRLDRQRRRAGAALAQLLRGDPGVDGGRRAARLCELSAVHAHGRARLLRAPVAPARRHRPRCW